MSSLNPRIYIASPDDSQLVSKDANFREKFIRYNVEPKLAQLADSAKLADFIVFFQEWSFKLPEYAKQLANDSFFKQFCEKIYVINYDSVVREGFLPGCYVSLTKSIHDENRFKSCAYPKTYNEHLLDAHSLKLPAQYTFSFRGTLHSHPIRQKMFKQLENAKDALMTDNTKAFHSHSEQEKKDYLKEILRSYFVLCPRGSSPNSYRLYETMSLARCPVIISDEWVETPGPDWSKCSIRVPESQIDSIETILNKYIGDAEKMGVAAKAAWLKYFTEESTYQNYLEQLCELHYSDKSATKSYDQYLQHWNSKSFLENNGWTIRQKIYRRLKNLAFW